MRTDVLYVVAGMSRGGTNLLWNIVQSHPAVIDSYYELNEILGGKTGIGFLGKCMVEMEALSKVPIPAVSTLIKERIAAFARKSFVEVKINREKYPGVSYEASELDALAICTKLVSAWEVDLYRKALRRNDALKYIPLLKRAFSNVRVIFLIRNGLAVAEGWGRRGASIDVAAYWYDHYVRRYEAYVEAHPDSSMIVRFEDLVSNPFDTSQQVYNLLGLKESRLDSLRIAIKPTIRSNQRLKNVTEKEKIWLQADTWLNHVDVAINDAQIARLAPVEKETFMAINHDVMSCYGYYY